MTFFKIKLSYNCTVEPIIMHKRTQEEENERALSTRRQFFQKSLGVVHPDVLEAWLKQ